MLKLSIICVCICCIYCYFKTRRTALFSQDLSPVVFTSGWLPSGPDEVVVVLSNCGLHGQLCAGLEIISWKVLDNC
jgi:hypothetical protein